MKKLLLNIAIILLLLVPQGYILSDDIYSSFFWDNEYDCLTYCPNLVAENDPEFYPSCGYSGLYWYCIPTLKTEQAYQEIAVGSCSVRLYQMGWDNSDDDCCLYGPLYDVTENSYKFIFDDNPSNGDHDMDLRVKNSWSVSGNQVTVTTDIIEKDATHDLGAGFEYHIDCREEPNDCINYKFGEFDRSCNQSDYYTGVVKHLVDYSDKPRSSTTIFFVPSKEYRYVPGRCGLCSFNTSDCSNGTGVVSSDCHIVGNMTYSNDVRIKDHAIAIMNTGSRLTITDGKNLIIENGTLQMDEDTVLSLTGKIQLGDNAYITRIKDGAQIIVD